MRINARYRYAVPAAVAAVAAVTLAGCSSDGGDTAAPATTTTAAASPSPTTGQAAPTSPAPAPAPATEDTGEQGPAETPAPAPPAATSPAAPQGGDGEAMTRDQATEQLKQLLGDPKDAHWEGDTLKVDMSWGGADIEGMDGVCEGAQMILKQYGGTMTMTFPDGSSLDCSAQ